MITKVEQQRGLGSTDPAPDYDDGRLSIKPRRYLVHADGQIVQLTARELALLVELSRYAGRTRSREQLIEVVWGSNTPGSLRRVDFSVARLRPKLEAALPDLRYIHSDFNRGYLFERRPAAA